MLPFLPPMPLSHTGSQPAKKLTAKQLTASPFLNDAIQTTSQNSNSVPTLDTPFADPDAEALRGKINELINALRR